MPSEFLNGIIPKLTFSSSNVSLIDGAGQFSKGGTLNLFIQGRNRAGYTEPSVAIAPITYTASQAIQISFPFENRTTATDFHYYVVSHSPTGLPEDAQALFHWTNYEVDQTTLRPLNPVVLSRDEHVAVANTVATPSDLPTGNLIDGMTRLVIGKIPASAYYCYEKYELRSPDRVIVIQPHLGEKWVRTGSPNVGSIVDVFGTDGCAQPIQSVSAESLILPPSYPADGTKGTPLKIIYHNDGDSALPAGTAFNLGVSLDGALASQLFDGKLMLTPRGFVDLSNGSLDTSNGSGGTMPDIDGEFPYSYGDRSTLVLHKDLPVGHAYLVEVAAYFSVEQFEGQILEGSQISIFLAPAAQSGDPAFAIWKVTGDIVLSDSDRLRVVPGIGLEARMLSGAALIKRFVFPDRGDRAIYGIQPNLANQKITLDGNGSLFYRGTGTVPGTEAVRSLVSCEVGYSAPSAWSNSAAIAANGSIAVTLTYPCDADGYGVIRSDYPYLAGNTSGRFNPPYLQLFVRRSSDGKTFQLPVRVTVLADVTQILTVSSLADVTEVAVLPTRPATNFCLFDPPSVAIASSDGGILDSDTYSVAVAYYFDGSSVSSISHDPAQGCISEIPGTIEDLFAVGYSWGPAIADSSIRTLAENETFPWQTRRLYGEKRQIYFDPNSTALDDGSTVWRPTWRVATVPGRWVLDERTAWYTVSGSPDSAQGMIGDIALDTSLDSATIGNVYKKTGAATWTLSGNIRGAAGQAASVRVGEVRSLSPRSVATVNNTGTSGAAVLDFGLPVGATGAAATIQVGSVVTLEPGSQATVNNSGTDGAAVLDFGIPAGVGGNDATATTKGIFKLTNDFAGTADLPILAHISQNVTGAGTLDLVSSSNKIRFHYDTEADLPSPSNYHGMFAHVHATGSGYVAHAGDWHRLAGLSQVQTFQKTQAATAVPLVSAASITVDCSNNVFRLTLNHNTTLSFVNLVAGMVLEIEIIQGQIGGILTFPSICSFAGDRTLSVGAGKVDVLTAICFEGTKLRCVLAKGFA